MGSAEYRAVSDGLLTGRSASEAIAAAQLDGAAPTPPPPTPPTTSHPSAPYAPPTPPYTTSYAAALSSRPPLPFPAAAGRDWGRLSLAAAALLGLGTSAFLLARPHLPTIHLTWQAPPPPPPGGTSAATSSFPSPPHSAGADGLLPLSTAPPPPPAPSAHPHAQAAAGGASLAQAASSSVAASTTPRAPPHVPSGTSPVGVGVDRLGVRVLVDDEAVREERLLRGLGDLKEEVVDIASVLREASMDQKRILLALQQTLEQQARERREEAAAAAAQQKQRSGLTAGAIQQHRGGGAAAPAASADVEGSTSSPRTRPSLSVDWSSGNGHNREDSSPAASTGSSTPPPPSSPRNHPARASTPALPPPSAAPPLPLAPSPSASAPAPVPSSSSSPVEDRVARVRSALALLSRSSPPDVCQSTLQALSLYLNNLATNLSSNRYRKVLTTNAVYQSRVAPVPGAVDILLASGFALRGAFLEWGMAEEEREVDVQVLTESRELIKFAQANLAAQKNGTDTPAVTTTAPFGQQQLQPPSVTAATSTPSCVTAAPLSLPLPSAQSISDGNHPRNTVNDDEERKQQL